MTQQKRVVAVIGLTLLMTSCSDDGQGSTDQGVIKDAIADRRAGDSGMTWPSVPAFRAGFAAVKITPTGLEGFVDWAMSWPTRRWPP